MLGSISTLRYFAGEHTGSFTIYGSNDGEKYTEISKFTSSYCFAWYDVKIESSYKYIKIDSNDPATLGEVAFYNKKSTIADLTAISESAKKLIDEKASVPDEISYLNSAYFDEIYFARSAFEYANNLEAYEWVHPPLGKLIQSIPIHFMGMTPFAYRLLGNIAGILMILVIYILAKNIFKSRKLALLAGFLIAFDTFHFAQTRIGTVDSFLVLFILTSALFMYRYISSNENTALKNKIKNLGFCGLFFGLAVCVKWSALYSGLGLAIVFFSKMIYEYFYAKKDLFKQYATIIPSCIAFFVVIPLTIYILCYLLFPNVAYYKENSLGGIVEQTKLIYDYHSGLDASHPYSSEWYTWPATIKPVWFYASYPDANSKSTIAAIGNPAIWWFGIIALIFVLINSISKKNKENAFIIILFLASWLPYAFIGRIMFLYHFFPSLPFMILAIVSFIKYLTQKTKQRWIPYVYMFIVLTFFAIFYPVASGYVASNEYIDSLKWFSTWIF